MLAIHNHYFRRISISSVAKTISRSFDSTRSFSTTAILALAEMEKVNTTERLKSLRDLMKKSQVDVYSTEHGNP